MPTLLPVNLQFFSDETGIEGGGSPLTDEQFEAYFTGEPANSSGEIDENSAAAPELTPEPERYTVKADGSEHQFTLDELMQHASMGLNYTRKTQELANERNSLEQSLRDQFMQEYEPYDQLKNLFEQNPALTTQFQQLVQGYFANPENQPQAPQMDITQHPQFQQLQQQLQTQQSFFDQWQAERQREAVQKEWNDLTSRYPDAEQMKNDLVQFADQNGVNLEVAYRNLNFDKVRQMTQEQIAQSATKKKVVTKTAPSTPSSHQPSQNPLEEAWAAFGRNQF